MRLRPLVLGAAAILVIAACTSLDGLSGTDGGIDATPDAASPPPADASGGDGGTNVESGAPDGCTGGCVVPKTLCSAGTCVSPSCAGLPATCGASHDTDCCASILVSGSRFDMGRSTDGGSDMFDAGKPAEIPQHFAQVSDYWLDVFEVTVGRFRKFVAAYGGPPGDDAGAHPKIAGSGWQTSWEAGLPPSKFDPAVLRCSTDATWTDAPGANEDLPINCVEWYEMFAFCLWDGGRLPTEAEWEFSAAAGLANQLYPWGAAPPDDSRAIFGCVAQCLPPVGSRPLGANERGIMDLGGSLWEFTLDVYSDVWYSDPAGRSCTDCANLVKPTTKGHVIRGGGWKELASELRSTRRDSVTPTYRDSEIGFRCAR